ncbi:MAG: hypothetical protein JWN02_1156 [Acidobacteria bacterium]|nr:hypothetical protein [Acidobacteriota bacterium]
MYDGREVEAKVLLETDEVIVRGALKLKVPFASLTAIEAGGGVLSLRWEGHELRLPIGGDAVKWAEKIRHPKSVLVKLGVKQGQKISIVGTLERSFVDDLETLGMDISHRLRKGSDVIFYAVAAREELTRMAALKEALHPSGAVWVIRPKGSAAISDVDVIRAGRAAGLIDVKVVRFSPTHTAEKLVHPVAKR